MDGNRRSAEEGSPLVADGLAIQWLVGDRIEPQRRKGGPLGDTVGPLREAYSA